MSRIGVLVGRHVQWICLPLACVVGLHLMSFSSMVSVHLGHVGRFPFADCLLTLHCVIVSDSRSRRQRLGGRAAVDGAGGAGGGAVFPFSACMAALRVRACISAQDPAVVVRGRR